MKKIILYISAFITCILISCVSSDVYDAVVFSRDSLQMINDSLQRIIAIDNQAIISLDSEIEKLRNSLEELKVKHTITQENYDRLKQSSAGTTQDLMNSMESLQITIANKQREIHDLQDKLAVIQQKLKAREDAMTKLKQKLQNALVGFAEKGMTVSIKNGKVYVSLSNQLLFSSGSTDIDEKGKEALLELAKILNEQNDINILVEGHTDDQQVRPGAKFKDNWDLSVLRATEVVRFLTIEGTVDPMRITSSGRGEYFPVEKGESPEIRAVNRRTEIILTPKLEELFEIINE